MAKASPTPAIMQNYVHCVVGQWAGDLGFATSVLANLSELDIDQADILFVLETGTVSDHLKEDAHDTYFSMHGSTIDGVRLSVTLSFNPHIEGLCVREVAAL